MDSSGLGADSKSKDKKHSSLKLVYQESENIVNNQHNLQSAFAILFEETMKRRQEDLLTKELKT
jgi:hypothetical protein